MGPAVRDWTFASLLRRSAFLGANCSYETGFAFPFILLPLPFPLPLLLLVCGSYEENWLLLSIAVPAFDCCSGCLIEEYDEDAVEDMLLFQ